MCPRNQWRYALVFAGLAMVWSFAPVLGQISSDPWADSVVVFEPGIGQNLGQQPQYFPQNVLGPPDTNATLYQGSADPAEILSLGLGGRIVLAFTDNVIFDGPGPDFTVFENAFLRQFGPKAGLPFAEPARVAVSKDGVHFLAFAFDSLSLKGLAGVTPTRGRADPTNPDSSGGDHFDLAEVGLDTARFVELVDVTAIIKDNPDHPYWDPTLSGFDLDAVVAVHSAPVAITGISPRGGRRMPADFSLAALYPNPVMPGAPGEVYLVLNQKLQGPVSIRVFNLLGQPVGFRIQIPFPFAGQKIALPVRGLASGIYFVRLESASKGVSFQLRVIR